MSKKTLFYFGVIALGSCGDPSLPNPQKAPNTFDIQHVNELSHVMQQSRSNQSYQVSPEIVYAISETFKNVYGCRPPYLALNTEICQKEMQEQLQGIMNSSEKEIILKTIFQFSECQAFLNPIPASALVEQLLKCGIVRSNKEPKSYIELFKQNLPSFQQNPYVSKGLPKSGFFLSDFKNAHDDHNYLSNLLRSPERLEAALDEYYQKLKRGGIDTIIYHARLLLSFPTPFKSEIEVGSKYGFKRYVWIENLLTYQPQYKETATALIKTPLRNSQGELCYNADGKLFADIRNPKVREEIKHWLAYIAAALPADGLLLDDHTAFNLKSQPYCDVPNLTGLLTDFVNELTTFIKSQNPSTKLILAHHPIDFARRKLNADWYSWRGFDMQFIEAYVLDHWENYMAGYRAGEYQGFVTLVSDGFSHFPASYGISKFCFLKKSGIAVLGYQNRNHNRNVYWDALKQCP